MDTDIIDWVDEIVADIVQALGDGLTGIYLHGSLAMGSYYRPKSDLDLLVVYSEPLDPKQRERVAWLLLEASDRRPTTGSVEASVLQSVHTRRFTHPSPYEMHFGEELAEAVRHGQFDYTLDDTDPDLAAHCTVVRSRGLRLFGEEISQVFSPVPVDAYLDSILGDLAWILEGENLLASPFYGVLNACRVFMVNEEGPDLVASKEEAAQWAHDWAPPEHRPLIEQCLDCYRSSAPMSPHERPIHGHEWDRSQLLAFRDWARAMAGAQPLGGPEH